MPEPPPPPPLLNVTAFVTDPALVANPALVADPAVVADPALVAEFAVAALPVMLIPQVPEAPDPPREGTSSVACAAPAVPAPVPPLAIGSVPATCVLSETPDSAPPRVSEPEVFTVPVSVMPLTEPVPLTEVTVPVFEVKPDGLVAE